MSRREEPRYRDHDEWSDEMYRRQQQEYNSPDPGPEFWNKLETQRRFISRKDSIAEFRKQVRINAALSQQMELTEVVKCITGTDDEVWDILIKYAKKDTAQQKAGTIEVEPVKKRGRPKKKKP